MPNKFYHGRTGIVWNVTKRALGVEVNKEVGDRERKESGCARERTYKAATPTTPSLPSPLLGVLKGIVAEQHQANEGLAASSPAGPGDLQTFCFQVFSKHEIHPKGDETFS